LKIHEQERAYKQKENYSGKKKRHTKKNTIISDENREIRYFGPTVEGKKHDYRTLTDEFPTELPTIPPHDTPPLPGDFRFRTDPAYIGIEKDFPWLNVIITLFHSEILNKFKMPVKKPKGGELTQYEKHLNKLISGIRIKVNTQLEELRDLE